MMIVMTVKHRRPEQRHEATVLPIARQLREAGRTLKAEIFGVLTSRGIVGLLLL